LIGQGHKQINQSLMSEAYILTLWHQGSHFGVSGMVCLFSS